MEQIEIVIYVSNTTEEFISGVLSESKVPWGGLVYAGICRLLTEPEPLESFPDPLDPEASTDLYISKKVVLSKFTYGRMAEKYGNDITRALTHATTQMVRIGYAQPDLLDKWYRFSLPGSGSGKISKTNNA
jgi:hypothetical protein